MDKGKMRYVFLALLLICSFSPIAHSQTVFQDNFEDGTLNKWAYIGISVGNSVGVNQEKKKNKNYGLRCIDNSGTESHAFVQSATLTEYPTYYCRFYFYIPQSFFDAISDIGGDDRSIWLYSTTGGGSYYLQLDIGKNSGVKEMYLRPYWDYNPGAQKYNGTLSADTWYCFEVLLPTCTLNNGIKWWINGSAQTPVTEDLRPAKAWNYVSLGLFGATGSLVSTVYLDEIVVSTQRIGMLKKKFPININ